MRLLSISMIVLSVSLIANTQAMAQGVWTPLKNPNPNGGTGTMLLLTDGTVIAQAPGVAAGWNKLTPDSTGDYVNGTWKSIASMGTQRLYFGSVVLPSGKVFVLGGEYSGAAGNSTLTNTGEIYDPVSNSWTPCANFPQANFGDDPAVLLNNGQVLCGYIFGAQTYLYNPATNSWTQTGTKLLSDASDEETWLQLPNGNILTYNIFASIANSSGSAQQYSPVTGKWTPAGTVPVALSTPLVGYELGPGARLPDGRYLLMGATRYSAIYTPSTNNWVAGPSLPVNMGADDAPGAMLPNGHFIFAADTSLPNDFTPPTHLYDFNYLTNTLTDITPSGQLGGMLNDVSFVLRMLVLPNGHLLLGSGDFSTVWDYAPAGSPLPSWQPTITSITNVSTNTYTLKGTQLTGISEGASYGDDVAMSTNYPIVRLQAASGAITYAKTTNWTPGVATGTLQTSVQFVLPSGTANGTYQISVSASGISSASQPFLVGPANVPSNVTALFNSSTKTLTLTGDANANSLTVSYQAGVLKVTGANGTAINNSSAAFTTAFTGQLVVNAAMNDGNDSISFIGVNSSTTNITLGAGNDTAAFSLCGIVTLNIDGGAGVDTLFTTTSSIEHLNATNIP